MNKRLLIVIMTVGMVSVVPGHAAPADHDRHGTQEQQTKSLDHDTKQWSQQFDGLIANFGQLLAGWTAVFVEKAHKDIDSGLNSLEDWLNAQHQPKK
jgi:hypothetical protein